ncbi:MAG TPA: sulfatase [Usitatibacter sp.]|nr:sulfatase [Usitatibacter sp.]
MDRRHFLQGLAAAPVLSAHARRPEEFAPSAAASNVVVIVADDMRWDAIGLLGNRVVHTPNLDALASDGVVGLNHFVTTSICPVSRASIMTGQYARRHGIWDFDSALSDDAFAASYHALLRAAGYRVGFVGKWGLGAPLPATQFDYWAGFAGQGDYYRPENGGRHLDAVLADRATDFLASVGDSPFCLTLCTKGAHAQDGAPEEFQPDAAYAGLYEGVSMPRPATATDAHFARLPRFLRESEARRRWEPRYSTEERFQHTIKQYYRLVTGVDAAVGRVVAALNALGLYDRTAILFTSDNGFFLGEHGMADKWWGYEESIRTPFVLKLPGGGPRLLSEMILNIDVAPTVLAICGQRVPAAMQGRSALDLLGGRPADWRPTWLYEHLVSMGGIPESEGVRGERFKYLRFDVADPANELLFDLDMDPFEESNLAADPRYRSLLLEMRDELARLRLAAR